LILGTHEGTELTSVPSFISVLKGSNLQALIDAIANETMTNARITQVISNRKAAYGLTRAKEHGIPTAVLSMKTWLAKNHGKTREDYDHVLAKAVLAGAEGKSSDAIELHSSVNGSKPDLIVLAGFMHIVSPEFLAVLGDTPCINLHPALPGQFDGIEAIKRAHDAFQAGQLKDGKTGVMVHEVVAEVDRGTPIVVREIECKQGESLEGLEGRIHTVEHQIIVEATKEMLARSQ
jgi:phosphoribosylglycinamide formyltransferase